MSLRTRLLATLVPAMLILFLALFQLAFTTSRSILEEQILRESRALAEAHAGEFELLFETARTVAEDLALEVADVSDKGAAAALFMAITHTLVREVARRHVPPAEVLRRINRTLADENPASMFVTLVYGEYHSDTGCLRLVNAGHNPPMLRHGDGEVHVVEARPKLPLGAMPDTRYETLELRLEPDDGLLLYSDGITDACNPQHEEWGLDRLRQALGEL